MTGEVAADDAQGAGKGDPVRIASLVPCGLVHQVPLSPSGLDESFDLGFCGG